MIEFFRHKKMTDFEENLFLKQELRDVKNENAMLKMDIKQLEDNILDLKRKHPLKQRHRQNENIRQLRKQLAHYKLYFLKMEQIKRINKSKIE